MNPWQARVSFVTSTPCTEDQAIDLTGSLIEYAAIGGIARDGLSGSVTLTVDAQTPAIAATQATELVAAAAREILSDIEITEISVMSEAALLRELAEPLYPEVVGYAEIAELANVSRQAARKWADNPTFPAPVIETAQGPLRRKDAVRAWLDKNPPRQRRSEAA